MTTTLIKSKLFRAGGSKISLFGKVYHFKPADAAAKLDDKEVDHVCAVPNEDAKAIYKLLSIKEGYELAEPDAELPVKPAPEVGQTIAGDAAKPTTPDVTIKGQDGEEINLSKMTPEDLRIFAREEFKIIAHHKWKDETVIAKIIEAMRAGDE
jgi:xanthine/CO dehydrogenase XdhC/CoxF family maturation factor